MDLPKRKAIRLPNYDYSSPGAYFVTICTQDKQNLFWKSDTNTDKHIEADSAVSQNETPLPADLTKYGAVVNRAIKNIPAIYPDVILEKYVVMPNHIHLLLRIDGGEDGSADTAPSVSVIVGQMKRWASKQAGHTLWQKSFHEHVIRGERDFLEIWKYIDANPYKWENDCYFVP